MPIVKSITNRITIVRDRFRYLRRRYTDKRFLYTSPEEVFTHIFKGNKWRGKDSVSGTGSDLRQTKRVAEALPTLLNDLNTTSILDIPCGDFHWMSTINLDGIDYLGADIVHELVQHMNESHEKENIQFRHMNLIQDPLPKAGLVICRDCLVHFSFADIFTSLRNICDSQSQYLLTTTFSSRKKNRDILTGQWQPINLQGSPFDFPQPLRLINEECTEKNGAYTDKSLGLWRIKDIERCLPPRNETCVSV